MRSVFISYSWTDRRFVEQLTRRLLQEGLIVWLDEAELNVGDALVRKISEGIETVDYVIVVLSVASLQSYWVQKEISLALSREVKHQRPIVLPIMVEPCRVPGYLHDKLYADFTDPDTFDGAFRKLIRAMGIRDENSYPA